MSIQLMATAATVITEMTISRSHAPAKLRKVIR